MHRGGGEEEIFTAVKQIPALVPVGRNQSSGKSPASASGEASLAIVIEILSYLHFSEHHRALELQLDALDKLQVQHVQVMGSSATADSNILVMYTSNAQQLCTAAFFLNGEHA
jgi:hypothetical protein